MSVSCIYICRIHTLHHGICPTDSHSPLTAASQHVCGSESSLNTEIPEIHLLLLEGVQERATAIQRQCFPPQSHTKKKKKKTHGSFHLSEAAGVKATKLFWFFLFKYIRKKDFSLQMYLCEQRGRDGRSSMSTKVQLKERGVDESARKY